MTSDAPAPRQVRLRDEHRGRDFRALWAYVDGDGNLHIDGQHLGPGTAIVSDDGEYEWFETIKQRDVPRLVALLGGREGDDVLDLLATNYIGDRSYELERRIRDSDIPVELFVWS